MSQEDLYAPEKRSFLISPTPFSLFQLYHLPAASFTGTHKKGKQSISHQQTTDGLGLQLSSSCLVGLVASPDSTYYSPNKICNLDLVFLP